MADIKFACPHCSQHINCDSLWGGHQLECPSCKNQLMVPAPAGPPPAPAPAAAPRSSLVPKPPEPAAPKLGFAQGAAASQGAAGSAPRPIPIRNLAPPPPPKANVLLTILKVAGAVAVLGVAGYFGFIWVRNIQEKSNASTKAEEAKNSGESQVGHIANLNAVLDATEPGHIIGERPRRGSLKSSTRPSAGSAASDDDEMTPTSATDSKLPVVAPVWTLDLAAAKIPEGRANGMISGTNFLVETATIIPSSGAQVLRLTQGSAMSPDRELLIYLHLKPGEKLGGQNLAISQDLKTGVPSVTKRWKSDPRYAPSTKSFTGGYAMKLELGALTNGMVPGKIFLALPDAEKSVVAGLFRLTLPTADSMMQAPTPAQAVPTAGDAATAEAMRRRYGLGK